MEDSNILELWKNYGQQLDESLRLNRKHAEELTTIKVQSALARMQPVKIFTIITGIVWVGFVDMILVNSFTVATAFFLVSAMIQVLLTKLAIGIYIYQLILINRVDISEPILATQQQLAKLKSSTLWVTRILFLQLPVWTTFYWNKNMLETGNMFLYFIQALVTLSLLFIALWLFLNIRYSNRDKRWFQLIFNGKEWQPLIRSMDLLQEVESYEEAPKPRT